MGVSIVVMAHPKRKEWAEDLADQLDCPIIWDEKNVMWDTGRRALLAGIDMGGTHHLVIQDDCILSEGLLEVLPELTRPGPVSLYAGRNGNGRKAMTMARNAGTQWFRYIGLVWGPAVMQPVEHLGPLVEYGDRTRIRSYDQRLTAYWRRKNIACWYTAPSLVNHRCGDNPSLKGGNDAREAEWFGSGVGLDWSAEPLIVDRDAMFPQVTLTDGKLVRHVRYGSSVYRRLSKRPGWELTDESQRLVELVP